MDCHNVNGARVKGIIDRIQHQLHVEWHFHSSWTHESPHPTLFRKRNMAWMPLTVFCRFRCLTNSYCQSRLLSYRSSLLLVVYLVDVVFHPFCFLFFGCKYTINYSHPNNFTSFFEKQQNSQEDEYTKPSLSSTRRNNVKSFRFAAHGSTLLFRRCL